MFGLALILTLGLALLWAGAVLWTGWMLTHPPRRTYASAVARGFPGDPSELDVPFRFEHWTVRSRGRTLPVWDIQGADARGPVIVLTHGWADSRIGALPRIAALAPLASRLVAWDLPGHGEATGFSGLGMREAADLRALIDELNADRPIVLMGWSMGAGVSIVAAQRGAAAVIAESPYRHAQTPALNVLRARGLPHRFTLAPAIGLVKVAVRERTALAGPQHPVFDRAAYAAGLLCPLLVIHGADDEICPIDDGRTIADAAPDGRMVEIGGAGHNDLWTAPALAAQCVEAVREFLAEALRTPRS